MPKGKKKAKRKPQRPKLSPLNKFLYWVLMVLGCTLILSSFILFSHFQQALGEANHAIAVEETWTMLLLMIPLLPAIVAGATLWDIGYVLRIPLIPSGERTPDWKKKEMSPAQKWTIVIALALWLISFVPAIGAIYDRVEINATHIDTYAMFGHLEEHRSVEDATEVRARIYYTGGKGSHGWRMSYTVRFADGASFTFQKMPSVMLEIDALFPDVPKTVEGTENFEKLCDEYQCNAEMREQLKRLFLMDD